MKDYNFCIFRVIGYDLSRYTNITKEFAVSVFTEPFIWYLERDYTLDKLESFSVDDWKKLIIQLDKDEDVYAYDAIKTGISRPIVYRISEDTHMLLLYETKDNDEWYEMCANCAYNKIRETDKK